MDELSEEQRKRLRLPTRLSIRAMMVLVFILGSGFGWVVHKVRVQRGAVAAIQRGGNKVWYDWEWNNGSPNSNGKTGWPKLLVDGIGVDYVAFVPAVYARNATDSDLVHIANLTRLEYLILPNSKVTDGGLVHLMGLSKLRCLNLEHTKITDAGLSHLESLASLQELGLGNTGVGDAGLARLKGLTALRELDLANTQVTDTGVKDLQLSLPSVKIRRR